MFSRQYHKPPGMWKTKIAGPVTVPVFPILCPPRDSRPKQRVSRTWSDRTSVRDRAVRPGCGNGGEKEVDNLEISLYMDSIILVYGRAWRNGKEGSLKTHVTWVILALLAASAFSVTVSHADVISDLLAYPPQASYANRQVVAAAPRPEVKPTPQYVQGAYTTRPASPRQVNTAPAGLAPEDRGPAQRTLMASQLNPQGQPLARTVDKRKVVSGPPATARKSSGQARVAAAQGTRRQTVQPYPQNYPAQAQARVPAAYSRPAQPNYYGYYPQQNTYAAPPNYYQGYYGYQGWGGARQSAACPPGRA